MEVGCNNGAFLSKLKRALAINSNYKGYSFDIDGIDIDANAISNPINKTLNLIHGFAEDISEIYPNKYDLIIHFELIEHLIDPIAFINSIYNFFDHI